MFRAGLYARVSTHDQKTLPMQYRAMREYAARRGWAVVMQVKEVRSGAAQREAREKLLEAARRREIDGVLVWRLDRWGRSVTDLLATLHREHLGVGFVSLTEVLDLITPAGRAMAGLLAVFAEFEREIFQERVRAGLAHARQPVHKLARPKIFCHGLLSGLCFAFPHTLGRRRLGGGTPIAVLHQGRRKLEQRSLRMMVSGAGAGPKEIDHWVVTNAG
ncbi:MAG: recombinase family protein [Candidatus Acidiferrales bacterium]